METISIRTEANSKKRRGKRDKIDHAAQTTRKRSYGNCAPTPSAPPSRADRRNGVPRRMQGVIEEVLHNAWRVTGIHCLRNAGKTSNCDLDECQVLNLVQARTRFAIRLEWRSSWSQQMRVL